MPGDKSGGSVRGQQKDEIEGKGQMGREQMPRELSSENFKDEAEKGEKNPSSKILRILGLPEHQML